MAAYYTLVNSGSVWLRGTFSVMTRTAIPRWLVIGLMAVAVVVSGVAAYSLGGLFADKVAPAPVELQSTVGGLYVEPKTLALGEVQETASHPLQLGIQNTTSQPKKIIDIQGSCGCTVVEPRELTIPPGGTGTVSVVIDLTKRAAVHSGVSRRQFSLRIDPVFAGDFAPTPGWLVTAEVLSQVTVDVTEVGFAESCVHQAEPASRRVRVATHTPLRKLDVEVLPASTGTASLVPTGPEQYSLVISPSPALPVGPFRFTVWVRPTGTNGQSLTGIPVEVTGEMLPTVRAFPRTVIIGEVDAPGAAEAEVVLTLPPGDKWRVGRIECDTEGTKVVAAGPAPDGGLRYRIEQPVTKFGDQQAVVSFTVLGPEDRKETVRVELRYHGRAK